MITSQSRYVGMAGALRKILHECKIETGSTHTDNYGFTRRIKFVINTKTPTTRVYKAIERINEFLGARGIDAKDHHWQIIERTPVVIARGIVVRLR